MRRPSWRFVLQHPAHSVAFGFGIGLLPAAPGTFGTLVALALFWAVAPHLNAVSFLALFGALFFIGIWACGRTASAMGQADHGGMVWDEMVAFLLVLFFTPAQLHWQASAFLLFRLFDILKPPPIRYYERTLKGGLAVMFDDLIAAFYALIVLALWKTVVE